MSYVDPSRIGNRYEWSENHAWAFTASVDCAEFYEFLQSVDALVDEASVAITASEVSVRAVDPANVAVLEVSKECVSQASGTILSGIHVSALLDEIPPYHQGDSEYDIEIVHGDEDDVVRVRNPEGACEAMAFDPDSVRQPPQDWPMDDEDHQTEATLQAPKIRGVLRGLADAEGFTIRITPQDGSILFESIKRHSHGSLYDWTLDADVSSGPSQAYSSDYVADIADGLWPDGEATVRFGDGHPLELDLGGCRFCLAPRIGPETEDDSDA